MRRVSVAGISGSGKTTFSRALAERLGVPYVELDALHHGPNWTEVPAEVLRGRVRGAIAAAPAGWVIDGNYRSKLDDIVLAQADTFVWLEPPLRVSLRRLARRTWRRWRTREELWHGNRETIRNLLGPREGLFVWTVRSYVRHKRQVPEAAARNPHARFVHLRSPAEAAAFLTASSGQSDST
jgi:adenylate kinase family enzyme